jgi:hypothetical protein
MMLFALVFGCKAEKPVEPPRKEEPAPAVIKPRHALLSPEQRVELGFPEDIIKGIEMSAGSEAEPFFMTVLMPSENLKGEKGFEADKLTGFSVHTKDADELIASYRAGLRVKGFLIFKSYKGYGSLPDIVTVVKGSNSYDILRIQGTEASNYRLDTKAIVKWLKQQQQIGSFVITGAGPDWVEARFIKQPSNMRLFAKNVLAFAPDVREYGPRTSDKLAERMKKINGFYLIWD